MPPHVDMMMSFFVVNNKKGFTLTELLIAVALIGILSGVAVTSIKANLPQYYLSGAARQVMTDMMLARMKAVSNNAARSVTFSSTGYTTGGVTTNITSQYKGVALSSTGGITFTPMGTTSTGSATITLTGSPGLSPKYVDVSAVGRVRIR